MKRLLVYPPYADDVTTALKRWHIGLPIENTVDDVSFIAEVTDSDMFVIKHDEDADGFVEKVLAHRSETSMPCSLVLLGGGWSGTTLNGLDPCLDVHFHTIEALDSFALNQFTERRDRYVGLSDRLRNLTDLTHLIVHDINNLVSTFNMLVQMQVLKGGEHADTDFLNQLTVVCRQLIDKTGSILSLEESVRGQVSLERVPFNLLDLVNSSVGVFKPILDLNRIEMKISVTQDADCSVVADRDKVRAVFESMLGYAIKFSPQDSEIRVKIMESSESTILLVEDNGDVLEKRIRDAQVIREGVPPLRYDASHFGIGMKFCQLVAELHSGELEVRPVPEGGCAVELRLPLV